VAVVGAEHLGFLCKFTSFSDSWPALSHKGRTIRELQESFTGLAQASSDGNILAMLWMASAKIVPKTAIKHQNLHSILRCWVTNGSMHGPDFLARNTAI
jgi:hypothetical protein